MSTLEVRGSCVTDKCGAVCCKFRVYDDIDKTKFTLRWCEHLNLDTRRCNIYETRPEGCRRYPDVMSLVSFPKYEGCNYYLADVNDPIQP
jgi:uncharacterized cysteine cluster protein YcgN (CxxCxxCC family)